MSVALHLNHADRLTSSSCSPHSLFHLVCTYTSISTTPINNFHDRHGVFWHSLSEGSRDARASPLNVIDLPSPLNVLDLLEHAPVLLGDVLRLRAALLASVTAAAVPAISIFAATVAGKAISIA